MTERSKREPGKKPKVEKLDLSKETVQDLTEKEAEAVEGGKPRVPPKSKQKGCTNTCQCTLNPRNCPDRPTFNCTLNCPIGSPF